MAATIEQKRLPDLLRICGRSLIAVFCVSMIANSLPLELASIDWGLSLTNRLTEIAPLTLIGVGMLRYAAILDLQGEERSDETDEIEVMDRDRKTRVLARYGSITIALLPILQILLFFGVLHNIDDQLSALNTNIVRRSSELLDAAKTLKEPQLVQLLQRAKLSPAPSLSEEPVITREQAIKTIRAGEAKARSEAEDEASATRFRLIRDTLRIIILCFIYSFAFYGMAHLKKV